MNYRLVSVDESPEYLVHHGVKGQKWGVRRYQNKDGSLTPAGKKRYDRVAKEYTNTNVGRRIITDTPRSVKRLEALSVEMQASKKTGIKTHKDLVNAKKSGSVSNEDALLVSKYLKRKGKVVTESGILATNLLGGGVSAALLAAGITTVSPPAALAVIGVRVAGFLATYMATTKYVGRGQASEGQKITDDEDFRNWMEQHYEKELKSR